MGWGASAGMDCLYGKMIVSISALNLRNFDVLATMITMKTTQNPIGMENIIGMKNVKIVSKSKPSPNMKLNGMNIMGTMTHNMMKSGAIAIFFWKDLVRSDNALILS